MKRVSTEEYIRIAEVSSSQNNALLMELAYSDAPEGMAGKLHQSILLHSNHLRHIS